MFKAQPNPVTDAFLSLFIKKSVNIILLGISNTIDTIQKYSSKYSFNITTIENVVFAPYRMEQIMVILRDKLEHIEKKMRIKVEFS